MAELGVVEAALDGYVEGLGARTADDGEDAARQRVELHVATFRLSTTTTEALRVDGQRESHSS